MEGSVIISRAVEGIFSYFFLSVLSRQHQPCSLEAVSERHFPIRTTSDIGAKLRVTLMTGHHLTTSRKGRRLTGCILHKLSGGVAAWTGPLATTRLQSSAEKSLHRLEGVSQPLPATTVVWFNPTRRHDERMNRLPSSMAGASVSLLHAVHQFSECGDSRSDS